MGRDSGERICIVPVQVSLACTLNAGGVRASWILQKLKIPTGLNATPALNLLGSSRFCIYSARRTRLVSVRRAAYVR